MRLIFTFLAGFSAHAALSYRGDGRMLALYISLIALALFLAYRLPKELTRPS